MQHDAVPALRFNRRRTPSTPVPSPRPRHPVIPRDEPRAANPGAKSADLNEPPAQPGDGDTIAADAERFLHRSKGNSSRPLGSAGWLQRAGLNIRRASDAQHLEAIALAYATNIRIGRSPLKAAIVAELETLSGRKRTRTTTDLHLVVERFVSYGGETPTERLAARKLISRDARAIQHLEAARVLPSRVTALAATPGEGLHAWARQNAITRRSSITPPNAIAAARRAKAEARQRALVHEVVITTRRPDGTRKARWRYAITGLVASEVAGLRARLRGLEKRSEPKTRR